MKRNAKPPVQKTTLFQSWSKQEPSTSWQIPVETGNLNNDVKSSSFVDLCDEEEDDDEALLQAAEMHESTLQLQESGHQPVAESLDENGFDRSAGHIWIYPTNYPVREYQYNIVKTALFSNTLVTLPTGLGKTFIAAVVMYNFYRWYPKGKIIFMAPTKPLVAQQIEACYSVMGIPQLHTAEMTGEMNPTDRVKSWRDRRVFFITPQVLGNDLVKGIFPAMSVKCLVIDEAHKASGNHAYCQVVRELVKHQDKFRILALSATPGSDIRAVQQVVNNLCISNIELRTEESEDIKRYSFERTVETIVVKLTGQMMDIKDRYFKILACTTERLIRLNVLYNRQPTQLSQFLLLKAREQFRQNPPPGLPPTKMGVVEGDFALAISLYHGYDLLQVHGLRSFWKYLEGIASGEKVTSRTSSMMSQDEDFCSILEEMRNTFEKDTLNESIGSQKAAPVSAHPKLDKLTQVVLDHFKQFQAENGNSNTRVMIFSQYRDSVQEITQLLSKHQPVVKVMSFIGQSLGKSSKGFSQKEQLAVMKKFREGGYNTLVATCVGEEGLDIGDVDLIVCFDAPKSPVRLVQRMGRTGRKRKGRIVVLMTEGKEEKTYNQSQSSKRSINKAILNSKKTLTFFPNNVKLSPEDLTPEAHKMFIDVKEKFVAEKKRGRTTTIQSCFAPRVVSSAFLSVAQRKEFEQKYQTYDRMPVKAEPEILCLSKKSDPPTAPDVNQPLVNLAEWLPWQTSLQATEVVGSSDKSTNIVEILNLIEMQAMADPSDHVTFTRLLNIDETFKPELDGMLKFMRSDKPSISETFEKSEKICQRKNKLTKVKRKRKLGPACVPKLEVDDDFHAPDVSRPEAEMNPLDADILIVEDDEFPEIRELDVPEVSPVFCWFGRVPPAPSVDFLDFMEDEKMDFSQIDMESVREEWERKMKPRLRKSADDSFEMRKPEVPDGFRKRSPGMAEMSRKRKISPEQPEKSRKVTKSPISLNEEMKKSPLFNISGRLNKFPSSMDLKSELNRSSDLDNMDASLSDSVFANMDDFDDGLRDEMTSPIETETKRPPEHSSMNVSLRDGVLVNMGDFDVGLKDEMTSPNETETNSQPEQISTVAFCREFKFTPAKKKSGKVLGDNDQKLNIDTEQKVDYHNAFDLSMSLFDDSPDSVESSDKPETSSLPFKKYTDANVEQEVKTVDAALLGNNEMDDFLFNDTIDLAETPIRSAPTKCSLSKSTPYCQKSEPDFLNALSPIVQTKSAGPDDITSKAVSSRNSKRHDSNFEGRSLGENELIESYCAVKGTPREMTFTQALSWMDKDETSNKPEVKPVFHDLGCFKTPSTPVVRNIPDKVNIVVDDARRIERSMNISKDSSDDSTKSNPDLDSSRYGGTVMDENVRHSLLEEFDHSFHSSLADVKIDEKNRNLSKPCEYGMSFDLGFDFDEESDSDVIPPTPPSKTIPVNSTRLSNIGSSSTLESTVTDGTIIAPDQLRVGDRTEPRSPVFVKEFENFPKEESEGFDFLEFRDVNSNVEDFSAEGSSPSSPSLLKRNKKRSKLRKKGLQEEKTNFVDEIASDHNVEQCLKIPTHAGPINVEIDRMGNADDDKNRLHDKPGTSRSNDVITSRDNDSSDEEIEIKKRKRLAIVSSPDITPLVKRQKKVVPRLDSSPEFKTPDKRAKTARKSLMPKFLPKEQYNEEEDFQEFKSPQVKIKDDKGKANARKVFKKPKSRMAAGFIDHEALLSDEDNLASSDESETNLDEFDASFINDMSQQCTQQHTQSFDHQAMYLQSMVNRVEHHKPYQISDAARNRLDIYSQVPEPDMDDYLEDSFCVEEADESDLELSEVTLTSDHDITMGGPKTRRARRAERASRGRPQPKRRRAFQISDSDEN